MTPEEAMRQQQLVITSPPNLFVRACPGAGKTRTVVDRFIRVADANAPIAAAVISFTNRASDEVSQRCTQAGRPDLVEFPHYVGTFDRFIATYIVRPFGDLGGPIRIIDSWDALDIEITAYGFKGKVSLDSFEVSPEGVLRFEPRPGEPEVEDQARQRLESRAKARYDELRKEGYLTCNDARSYAVRLLSDHPQILDLFRARFAEIIVDEAQDCSVDELAILELLRVALVPIVVVCDPHQSIYEWRDADPDTFDEFSANLEQITLNGNWRSSPAICALAGSIRGGPADEAVGPHSKDATPIALIQYKGWPSQLIGHQFADLVLSNNIEPTNAVMLAHSSSLAMKVAGAGFSSSQSNLTTLATACIRLVSPNTAPRERQSAFDRVQRLVLRVLKIDAIGHTVERVAELSEIDIMWLRRASLAVVHAVGSIDLDIEISEWLKLARAALAHNAGALGRPTTSTGTILRTPKDASGKSAREVLNAQASVVGIRHSTVHAAKGTEAEAVLMTIPRDRGKVTRTHDLLESWLDGYAAEPKRVLYVGVTRAERLSALAVPSSEAHRVLNILLANSVPHEVHHI